MEKVKVFRKLILLELLLLAGLSIACIHRRAETENMKETAAGTGEESGGFIKWVDFNVSSDALGKAYEYDRDSYGKEVHLNWIELLAYTAARTGGDFSSESQVNTYLEEAAEELTEGKSIEELTEGMKYYNYYLEAYTAVLGGMVGEYEIQTAAESAKGQPEKLVWEKRYGLKAFLPIAKDFPYSDYDDFGVSRSYGYRRQHLGHDMMGQTGTPIYILTRIKIF